MKKFFGCFIVIMFMLISFDSFGGQIKQVRATSFHSNGARIMGWYWLRSRNNYAEWVVRLPGNVDFKKPIAFCFSTLSTNTYSGGAGFNSKLTLRYPPYRIARTLNLQNDFRCLKSFIKYYHGNSYGIGYRSHGCFVGRLKPTMLELNRTIRVKVEYNGGHHSAVNRNSLTVVFITR